MNIVPLLEALSLIVVHTPIEQKELIKKFRYILSHTARKEFPDASIAELSEKVGMNRGTISNDLDEEMPKVAPSNEAHILTLLWEAKDKNNMVNFSGENSFYSIAAKQLVGKHSPDTALKTLLASTSVEVRGGMLRINSQRLIVKDNMKEMTRIIGDVFLRLVKTAVWNANPQNKDKKYQNTIVTRRIPENLLRKVHNEIYGYLDEVTIVKIREIIESFEKHTDYNFPEFSVSIFENF